MPYKISKVRNKKCYKVVAIKTGRIMAKCTTKIKAEKQVKYLYMLDAKKKKEKRNNFKNFFKNGGGGLMNY